ncbi:MAG: hypothetical protein IKK84_03585 [Clostridia bacterium]|nr:hypothetical protein [Clostridia bacterium]
MINKQKKGISLIVLVITIIVMIILAASVIVSLNNTGVIDKAGQAVDETNESELEHMDALDYLDKFTASTENPWDGNANAESFADGNGEQTTPYLISNAAELVYFAKLVNEGNTFEGKYVELTANINLNNIEFTPIGMGNSTVSDESQWTSSTVYFNGTFDGKGHIISNINIDKSTIRGVGLFGVIEEKAVIKNVEIFSGNIYGRAAVAGIAGYSKGVIENCINRAHITAVDSEEIGNSGQLAGGIAGTMFAGNIINCKNYGNVIGKNEVAMRSRGKCVGGIVGEISGSSAMTISKCYNYGNITSNYQQVGGIAGSSEMGEGASLIITDCVNNGKIHAKKPEKEFVDNVSIGFAGGITGWLGIGKNEIINCTNNGTVISDDSTVGGISGEIDDGAKITKCTNNGSVEGTLNAAGISGASINSFIDGSINNGNVTSQRNIAGITGIAKECKITNCTNSGTISGDTQCIAGIIGQAITTSIEKCNNSGYVTGQAVLGGIAGVTTDNTSTIRNCKNTGKINATNQQGGGVIGHTNGLIENCTNSGEVYSLSGAGGIASVCGNSGGSIIGCENRGKIEANNIAGGIVSLVSLNTSNITNCKNYGEVISNTQQAGGIAGTTPGSVTDCYNEGKIISNSTGVRGITGGIVGLLTGTITNSYNKGMIVTGSFEEKIDVAGGIAGLLNGGKISNVYNIGSVTGEATGAIIGENSGSTPGTIANTYYYTTENIKGVAGLDDVAGQFEKTDVKLDAFEAFKNSSFYAK